MPQGLNLRDRYELDRPLTDGRIASTYRGVETDSRTSVALKVVRASRLPEASARTEEALELLGQLREAQLESHARIYDFGTTDTGDLYLATRWQDGQPLVDSGRLHPAEALSAVRQAAGLLRPFSDHGLAHLNVRPDNLFLKDDGQLALTGLGTGFLLPPDGVFEGDEYWAPELDLPPRGFRRDFWQADLFALARTALELLNAQVTGASTRVPHIRLPDGLESAFESGPELCLLLEESLHEAGDRRPDSWGTLIDCLDRSLIEAPPEQRPATEQGEGAMQSLREMWADGLSDIDLRSGGRSFDPKRTQKVPTVSIENEGANIVLSEADGELISADQDITTEIRLPEPLAKSYIERRKPRSARAEEEPVPAPEQSEVVPKEDARASEVDHEVEELFASHTRTFEIPPEALPRSEESFAGPEPVVSAPSEILSTSPSRGPAIDWTRPGYAAKRSDPWESLRDLDWPKIGLAAGLLLALGGAFLLFRWFDRAESAPPTRSAQAPLEIDTSQVERAAAENPVASDSQSASGFGSPPPADQDTSSTAAETSPPASSNGGDDVAGSVEAEREPSTPLEALVADLPEQVVPTTQIVSRDDDVQGNGRAVRVEVDAPSSPASAPRPEPTPKTSPPEPRRVDPPRRGDRTEPSPSARPTQRPGARVAAERPRPAPTPTPNVRPTTTSDPAQVLLTRLDGALRGGDPELLFEALADDNLALLKQREDGRRLAVFAEIAAAGLESTERLLDDEDWSRALESANRLESQFPMLAQRSALRERAATGMERRAEQLIRQGDYGNADRQLRSLRALWPERQDIDEKLRRLAGRRQQARNERILAEVATAANTDKPHEAIALLAELEGQIASQEYERRRKELDEQLTRLDSSVPTVSLDPFDETSFVRGEALDLQLQIQDDYEVVAVELRLRPAGRDDFLDVPIEKVGGRVYRANIPPSLHGSRKIGIWVRAFDRSGNVGELGTERRPLRLKPRRARSARSSSAD